MHFRAAILLLLILLWLLAATGVMPLSLPTVFVATSFLGIAMVALSPRTMARRRRAIAGLLVAIVLGGSLVWAVMSAREAARRCCCQCPLKTLILALHNYNATYRSFPPAYIADGEGRPMHSWRVLILPFLGDDSRWLYDRYDFNEPWDGPHNKELLAARPNLFRCPSDPDADVPGSINTNYVAVVGAKAAWPGTGTRSFDDLSPTASETIMLAEVAGAGIPWTEPRDLNLDSPHASPAVGVSSHHFPDGSLLFRDSRPGVTVALAHGGLEFLPGELLDAHLSPDMLKIGGLHKEYLSDDYSACRQVDWSKCVLLAMFLMLIVVLFCRGRRRKSSPPDEPTTPPTDPTRQQEPTSATEGSHPRTTTQ